MCLLSPPSILVVDDEPEIRRFMGVVLTHAGFAVETAGDGLEALERFQARKGGFDLIVSDVVMPGMSGPELIEQIRQSNPAMEALFVSGDPGAHLGSIEPAAYLQKPFTPQEVLGAVRARLAAGNERSASGRGNRAVWEVLAGVAGMAALLIWRRRRNRSKLQRPHLLVNADRLIGAHAGNGKR